MKKIILIILICFCTPLITLANEWIEVSHKTYINIDKSQDNKIFYWIKVLNDGTMKPIKNQKIQFNIGYYIEDCTRHSTGLLAGYTYDLSGKVISSYISPFYNNPQWATLEPVIPQTVGETIHKSVCGYNQ